MTELKTASGPKSAPAPPSWDLARNRYEFKLPAGGADFSTLVAAFASIATDDATFTLTATHEDHRVVQRNWTGRCTADEFALMLAEARRFVLQATYSDGSRLWYDSVGTERWRWSTSGAAQDAALEFRRTVKRRTRRRRFSLIWPWSVLLAGLLMYGAWGDESPAADPNDPPVYNYTGPLWYTLIWTMIAVTGVVAIFASDWTGYGLSKRRYLRRLSSDRSLKWRRMFVIKPVDVTNQIGIGLVLGLPAGAFLAFLIAR
ncbi:hypothetical protein E0H73_40045 [Kribbella pittospori]|uniref:Uncharacterized protein n=1 Tax=Kribbella pittospori TaxID=722689 RepID=A0A4R0JX84_9ACTN|nr:hypothetical protein [Kribbella pittospori]TCC52131.1 hypothetical protein E0H73_40045 [Kribbella pittospori]